MTLRKNPTNEWLEEKIKYYTEKGAKDIAQRFLDTYSPLLPTLDYNKMIMIINKPNKPEKPVIKEKNKNKKESE